MLLPPFWFELQYSCHFNISVANSQSVHVNISFAVVEPFLMIPSWLGKKKRKPSRRQYTIVGQLILWWESAIGQVMTNGLLQVV
jgi:hypothetical protein